MSDNSPAQNALGLATGIAFGALLNRGGLADSATITGQLAGRDWRVFQAMATAVAVGAAGVELLRRRGLVDAEIKSQKLGGVLGGAVVFGAGMAVAGYCPGTAVAGAGASRTDALWAALGMLAGATAFVRLYPSLKPLLDAADLGRVRLGP